MGLDIYLKWGGKTEADQQAQYKAEPGNGGVLDISVARTMTVGSMHGHKPISQAVATMTFLPMMTNKRL